MFGPKLTRVKYRKGIGYADGSAHNIGDVCEVPTAQARAEIEHNIAEATSDPIGMAPTAYEMWPCPDCAFLNSEYMPACERCGRRLL
jgi:hypothetical protein